LKDGGRSRRITEVRNFRQALASPHLGSLVHSRSRRDLLNIQHA